MFKLFNAFDSKLTSEPEQSTRLSPSSQKKEKIEIMVCACFTSSPSLSFSRTRIQSRSAGLVEILNSYGYARYPSQVSPPQGLHSERRHRPILNTLLASLQPIRPWGCLPSKCNQRNSRTRYYLILDKKIAHLFSRLYD